MNTTTITHLTEHPVHTDPIDEAIALLIGSAMADRLVCDGSCDGIAGCSVAPVGTLPAAA